MRRVAIIGVGTTKFGELWDKSLRELGIEAGLKAIEDANITGNEIDAMYVGNMSAGNFINQEHIAALIADYAGLARSHVPTTRVEAACASGGLALRQGYMAVASGLHDIVVVGGAEKMTDISSTDATATLIMAADQEWEAFVGMTFPGLYALIATRHMHEYGTTREQMAHVAVKNHRNGALNPNAQFRKIISVEDVLSAPIIAYPLGLFDCSPVTDGASAVVLAPMEIAKKYTDTPIEIVASAQASDTLALHDRDDICTMKSTVFAARKAYNIAKIVPSDVDLAEVHDCFTINEIIATEDLGFFEKGYGGKAVEEGVTERDGDIAINPSGGLKAKGHPVGATGITQAVEIVYQLRGEAGDRQVDGAEIGLTHNIGGSGATAVVHIFKRGD